MVRSYDLIHGRHVCVPGVAFVFEKSPAFGGQMVIATPGPSSAFNPPALDQRFFLEPAQNRIQRTDPEMQAAARSGFDQLSDFVAMPIVLFEKRKNEKLWTAFFQFAIEH